MGGQALLRNHVGQLGGGGGGIERHDDAAIAANGHAYRVDEGFIDGPGEQVGNAGLAVGQDAPQERRAGQHWQLCAVGSPGGHQHAAIGIEYQDAVGMQIGQRLDGTCMKAAQVAGRQHSGGAEGAERHPGIAEIMVDRIDHGVGPRHRVADQLGSFLVVKTDDDDSSHGSHRQDAGDDQRGQAGAHAVRLLPAPIGCVSHEMRPGR